MKIHHPARVAVALAWIAFLWASSWADAQHPSPTAWLPEQVAVLRNGEVFQGRIAPSGDRYLVYVEGGMIAIRAGDVEFLALSLQGAYLHKRNLAQPGDAQGHVQLADWCQRRGLLQEALAELAEAKRIDPKLPMIGLVERRLEMSFVQKTTPPPDIKVVTRSVTTDELERMVRGMPPGTVERFTQTIQPLLTNNCTASGCHGPYTQDTFALMRIPAGRPASRRTTQRNLSTVLERVDRQDPGGSPILTYPIRPHGPGRTAVFTDHQVAQYKELVDWVYQVARAPSPIQKATPASHEEGDKAPADASPAVFEGDRDDSAVTPAGGTEAMTQQPPVTDAGIPSPPPNSNPALPTPAQAALEEQRLKLLGHPAAKVQRGATVPQFTPIDPFDPEIFNRRCASPPEKEPAPGP